MKPIAPLVFSAVALSLAGCAPKKTPKPNVSTDAMASVAAANEGVAPASPTGRTLGTDTKADQVGAKLTLPVLGPAPSWKLKDLQGREVSSDQFKGKVVVVDFWATWCPPCRAEIPGYVDLARKYGDKLAIVGVSVDEKGPEVVRDFVKKFGVSYSVVMAEDAVVSAFGEMEAIPTTFLIDRNGQIRDKKVGAVPTEEYEKRIQALLD